MKKQHIIDYDLVERSELSPIERKMEDLAVEAAKNAYVPYSKFQVGASVLLENGEIISASNQENAAYPSGICAERNALFYAGSLYPNVAVEELVVVAINEDGRVETISPCGACRQVLMETSVRFKPFKVLLAGAEKIIVLKDNKTLLPFGFDGSDLK